MEKSTTQLYPLIVSPYLALGSLSSWPNSLAKVGEFRHIQAFLISSPAPSFLFRLLFSTPSSVLLRFSPPPPPEKNPLAVPFPAKEEQETETLSHTQMEKNEDRAKEYSTYSKTVSRNVRFTPIGSSLLLIHIF